MMTSRVAKLIPAKRLLSVLVALAFTLGVLACGRNSETEPAHSTELSGVPTTLSDSSARPTGSSVSNTERAKALSDLTANQEFGLVAEGTNWTVVGEFPAMRLAAMGGSEQLVGVDFLVSLSPPVDRTALWSMVSCRGTLQVRQVQAWQSISTLRVSIAFDGSLLELAPLPRSDTRRVDDPQSGADTVITNLLTGRELWRAGPGQSFSDGAQYLRCPSGFDDD